MGNPRQRQITELVAARGECSVEFLAGRFGVSDMTIRRDLQALAEAGRVLRTHGGAAPVQQVVFEFQFLQRMKEQSASKEQIATAAASLVQDGQVVMLDSGTTTLAIARQLKTRSGLTIITSSLPIASELQYCDKIEVILLGGLLRRNAPDLIGALTEQNLESLHADVAFVGADGIDLSGQVYNASLAVGRMLGKMAAAADAVYVVADSGKIGRKGLTRFGTIAKWQGLVTDQNLSREHQDAMEKVGVRIIVARPAKASGNGRERS